jgi:hypothetical protein
MATRNPGLRSLVLGLGAGRGRSSPALRSAARAARSLFIGLSRIGYASPEGGARENQTLSEDLSREVSELLFLGERGVDPAGAVEGVGEDHEGRGCLDEERPLWRKVRVHLQEAELPERESAAEPDAPTPDEPATIDYDDALWWIRLDEVRRAAPELRLR